jgi:hypothetical protein
VSTCCSTSRPPCQSTAATPAKPAKVITPKNTPRTSARWIAASTTSLSCASYLALSAASRVKLCTMRICENASSAVPIASATRSCTTVLALLIARPKMNAAPTTTGTTASVVTVSCGCVIVSIAMPPIR